jgi:hypothetical protein
MGFGFVNGFINHLYARLGATSNYSTTANLHNSEIITAHIKLFFQPAVSSPAVPWQLLLAVEILQLHALRFYSSQPPVRDLLNSTQLTLSLAYTNISARITENIVLLLLRACMLRTLPSNGRCLQSHSLATGLYATLLSVMVVVVVLNL